MFVECSRVAVTIAMATSIAVTTYGADSISIYQIHEPTTYCYLYLNKIGYTVV